MSELKPCPFCGGNPQKIFDGTVIRCDGCTARTASTFPEEAESDWNKRTPDWIPVGKPFDNYPESAKPVLVATNFRDEWPLCIGYHIGGSWRITNEKGHGFCVDTENVTYWQPLPAAPRKEKA